VCPTTGGCAAVFYRCEDIELPDDAAQKLICYNVIQDADGEDDKAPTGGVRARTAQGVTILSW